MGAYELEICHLTGTNGVTEKIKKAMRNAAREFVYIGFLLWEVKRYEYFYEMNYGSVYEYAEAELGFKRSSTKNFIAICEEFCKRCDSDKTYPTMHLDDRWNDFKYSQLTELLSMSAKQREQAKPSMTVKQLRELKKADDQQEPKVKSNGQTSGQRINEPTAEEIEEETQRLNDLYCTDANIAIINGEEVQVSHYIMQELCRLAGIKYIDYEDYEINITMKD